MKKTLLFSIIFIILLSYGFAQELKLDRTINEILSVNGSDIAIADFNLDGKVNDYMVAIRDESYLLLNTNDDAISNQAFTNPEFIDLGDAPNNVIRKIDAGDINEDGFPDILYNYFAENGGAGYLLNDGQGNFNEGGKIGDISFPSDVKFGEFNDDGFIDVAILTNSSLYLYYGSDELSFTAGPEYAIDQNDFIKYISV